MNRDKETGRWLSRGLPSTIFDESKNSAGFTLIETLVASAVLLIFFGAMTVIFQSVTNLIGESRVRVVASALANERIERVRNLTYTDVGTISGVPDGILSQEETVNINGQDFTVRTTIIYVDDPFDGLAPADSVNTDYKRVKVEVSWGGAFASIAPLKLVTDVVPKGLESNVGGGTLDIMVADAVGVPVDGATVYVVNNDVVPPINIQAVTDSEGKVSLPGSPTCIGCYQLRAEKTGYSGDKTYSTSEVTNPAKPHANVIDGEVTSVTLAIDLVSSLSVSTTGSRQSGYPAFSGVAFTLRGSKLIGTDSQNNPVYKFEQNFVSGSGGQLTITDLEWDGYDVFFPGSSSVDLAGTNPIAPFGLLPNQNRGLIIVTAAAGDDSMLVIVQDSADNALGDIQVTLLATTGGELVGVTGASVVGDYGQVFFPSLSQFEYGVVVTGSGYLEASSSAFVVGDVKEYMRLVSE